MAANDIGIGMIDLQSWAIAGFPDGNMPQELVAIWDDGTIRIHPSISRNQAAIVVALNGDKDFVSKCMGAAKSEGGFWGEVVRLQSILYPQQADGADLPVVIQRD